MKRWSKAIALSALALVFATFFVGCSAEPTEYEKNDELGYTVSVKFDANGGEFTTGTTVIVDSFNLETVPKDANGKALLALLDPMDPSRIGEDKATAKDNCFLVGWYQQCEKSVDENGNETFTYAKPWDFEKDVVTVDPNAAHSATEPVLTLYAAWAPKLEIEVREIGTDHVLSAEFNPSNGMTLTTPTWNEQTGKFDMFNIPKREGYTLKALYLDEEGQQPITDESFLHSAVINYENATVENEKLTLYAEYEQGEWYRIYTVDQLKDNAGVNNCYEIMADLDFTGESWPTALMQGNYNGVIRGNGHKISNVTFEQSNNDKTGYGLFGGLSEASVIENLTFDNICFTVKSGAKKSDTYIGLFAGRISDGATISNVAVTNSVLQIDAKAYFMTEQYAIGLVCGRGDASLVDPAQITCEIVGENPDGKTVTVSGNSVTIGG